LDHAEFRKWIGQTHQHADVVTCAPVEALSATLDRKDGPAMPGTELPLLWHWLFFGSRAGTSELGLDGHERRGTVLPSAPPPRRMWAGGRLQCRHALRIGDEISRLSTVSAVDVKEGRSGTLVFVTLRHEISDARGIALTEEQDLVYRDRPSPGAAGAPLTAVPADEDFARVVIPTPVLLFRYSALTFNSHRIHYDHDYAMREEGYPGLLVQAPLIATLLADLLRERSPSARVRRFAFRAMSPLFDGRPFTLCGRRASEHHQDLWVRNSEGGLAMQARADFGR
jgi:3-methylfumaryl-CoA hydratase